MISNTVLIGLFVVCLYFAIRYFHIWWPVRNAHRTLRRMDNALNSVVEVLRHIETGKNGATRTDVEARNAMISFIRPQFQLMMTARFLLGSAYTFIVLCRLRLDAMDPCINQFVLCLCNFYDRFDATYTGRAFRTSCDVLKRTRRDDADLHRRLDALRSEQKRLKGVLDKDIAVVRAYRNRIAGHMDHDYNDVWQLHGDKDKDAIFRLAGELLTFCLVFFNAIDSVIDRLVEQQQGTVGVQ